MAGKSIVLVARRGVKNDQAELVAQPIRCLAIRRPRGAQFKIEPTRIGHTDDRTPTNSNHHRHGRLRQDRRRDREAHPGRRPPHARLARRPAALDAFVARGGIAVRTLAEIGQADIVISIVFDDAATRAVAMQPDGFIPAMRPGAIHVAMATISPGLSRELHDTHAARGQRYLASPVFGRPEAATNGELAIMGSGAIETYQAVEPILATAGTTRWVGPEPEQAMLLKLAGNHMILTMGDLLGETFALLRAGGISGAETKEALLDTLMPGIFAGYAKRMVDQPDAPRPSTSAIGRKDNSLIIAAAETLCSDLPLARFLRSQQPVDE